MTLYGSEGAVPHMVSDRHPILKATDQGPAADAVPDATGRRLLRLRWLLSGAIALTFALGRPFGGVVQGHYSLPQFAFDLAGDLIGGLAVWISLTWAYRQGRQHQTHITQALEIQRALNKELQRANNHLSVLSDVNRQIAESLTVDNLLDAAIAFARQIVPVRAAALVLTDPHGPLDARVVGATPEELARFRAIRESPPAGNHHARTQVLKVPSIPHGTSVIATCVMLPLDDGVAAEGWIELYLAADVSVAGDELALLETIAGVTTEAIVNARRRAREQRALYELDGAIAEERARIARDIHDGIAQTLAFQRMRIDLWQEWIVSDPDRLRAEFGDLKQMLREQIGELRRAIFALRPVQFDTLGFIGGLRRYITDFANQQGWAVEIDFHDVPSEFTPELEAACFRVIQEALTNSAKHAAATRVTVTLDEVDTGVRIIVRDDGHGFDPVQAATDTSHVGLRQMEERLATLRGQLTLLSQHGAGTEVAAWIPLIPQRYGATLPETRHP
jgi:signal transduction histidine kinase